MAELKCLFCPFRRRLQDSMRLRPFSNCMALPSLESMLNQIALCLRDGVLFTSQILQPRHFCPTNESLDSSPHRLVVLLSLQPCCLRSAASTNKCSCPVTLCRVQTFAVAGMTPSRLVNTRAIIGRKPLQSRSSINLARQ